jgi:predicted DNA-binding transcriptional regulator YafY
MKIKLKLCLTYDLVMELLSFGENMKVIKPKSLADQIKQAHQNAYRQY